MYKPLCMRLGMTSTCVKAQNWEENCCAISDAQDGLLLKISFISYKLTYPVNSVGNYEKIHFSCNCSLAYFLLGRLALRGECRNYISVAGRSRRRLDRCAIRFNLAGRADWISPDPGESESALRSIDPVRQRRLAAAQSFGVAEFGSRLPRCRDGRLLCGHGSMSANTLLETIVRRVPPFQRSGCGRSILAGGTDRGNWDLLVFFHHRGKPVIRGLCRFLFRVDGVQSQRQRTGRAMCARGAMSQTIG